MFSQSIKTNTISLPLMVGKFSMIPFDINSLSGLPEQFAKIVNTMLHGINRQSGQAYFTLHGKKLTKGQTLRRGEPHTDGNYDINVMSWGGGWKVGENGPAVNTEFHKRLYINPRGGIVMASNYEACIGWNGFYHGLPNVGGDCRHIELDKPFELERNSVYYGNNHFIHESLPMKDDVHRVLARITLPETHVFD